MNFRLRLELGTPKMVALQYLRRLALRVEQPILNSSRLDGSRAFLVIVRHVRGDVESGVERIDVFPEPGDSGPST